MVFLKIVQSILITAGISFSVAYFAEQFNKEFFLPTFILTTVLQFIIFYYYSSRKIIAQRNSYIEILSEQAQMFEDNGADVNCASCKREVFAPISIREPRNFTCPHCGTENSVYLNIETAVVTRPV